MARRETGAGPGEEETADRGPGLAAGKKKDFFTKQKANPESLSQ